MLKKINCITLIFLFAIKLSAQENGSQGYFITYGMTNVYMKTHETFVVVGKNQVQVYDKNSHEPVEIFFFDKELLNDLLYIDEQVLINKKAVYHHNFFKDFSKKADLTIPFTKDKNEDKEKENPVSRGYFDPFARIYVVSDRKSKIVYHILAETGETRQYQQQLEENETILPLSARYGLVCRSYKDLVDPRNLRYMYDFIDKKKLYDIDKSRGCYFPADQVSDSSYYYGLNQFRSFEKGNSWEAAKNWQSPGIVSCPKSKIDLKGKYYIKLKSGIKTFSVFNLKENKLHCASEWINKSNYAAFPVTLKKLYPEKITGWVDDLTISPDERFYIILSGMWLTRYNFETFEQEFEYGKWQKIE